MKKKTLKFVSKLIPLILSGKKTTTWRLFDDKDLKPQDEVVFLDKSTGKPFAEATITAITQKFFHNLTPKDWAGHENFESNKEMYQTYTKYYKQTITPRSVVKIAQFELTKEI